MYYQKKILIKIVCIIAIAIVLSIFYVKYISYKKKYVDWSFNNSGQKVEGTYGKKGIDINPSYNIKGEELVVAVVDTGIYQTNNLNDRIWNNKNEIPDNGIDDDNNGFIDDVSGWDFYNCDNSIYDNYVYDYHGTYIADTIARIDTNSKIMSVKFLSGLSGEAYDSVMSIKYAIDNGAKVVNCSWNFEEDEEELYHLIKDNKNVIFVCAAGNSLINLDENNLYPVSYDLENVISVMAIDNQGEKYKVSGYGWNVDIAAPGKDISVTLPENDESLVSGTSIATAYVTGVVATICSKYPDMSATEIRNVLINSSHKIDSLARLCKAEGIIDMSSALEMCNQEEK